MANYTDADAIAAHLGATLTPAQESQAETVSTAVTVWIDHRTGRSWQSADGSVTGEIGPVYGGAVYLDHRPVLAVSQVETRLSGSSDAWIALDPDTYYLAYPALGRLDVPGVSNGYDARVDYTSAVVAVPADLAHAATVLAADLLFPTLNPESSGVESISVAQNDISVKYAGAAGKQSASVLSAISVVDSYRRYVMA